MAKEKKTRVTVDLSSADYERLRLLRKRLEAPSSAGVIRTAIRIYDALLQATDDGLTVEVCPMGQGAAANAILITANGPLMLKSLEKQHDRTLKKKAREQLQQLQRVMKNSK